MRVAAALYIHSFLLDAMHPAYYASNCERVSPGTASAFLLRYSLPEKVKKLCSAVTVLLLDRAIAGRGHIRQTFLQMGPFDRT